MSQPDPEQTAALACPTDPLVEPSWKVLVVDDEEDVHTITRLALRSFRIDHKPLQFLHAHSAAEAVNLVQQHPDIAVVLLDVVMENQRAGLELVDFIRNQLNNDVVRIIVRTGQPGIAPEMSVVEDYSVDDYRLKTELTQNRLHAILMASLRTYETMLRGEAYARSLEHKVSERTAVIQQQKDQLETLNALKNKLFSILSHDLRSPLVTLHTLVQAAERQMLSSDDYLENLGDVRTSLEHTLPMLNQLLAWANSQLEGFHLQPADFELEDWLNDAIALQQAQAEHKGLQLFLAYAPPARLRADQELASLVLRNLLQNAIKFTPAAGEIRVQVQLDQTHALIEIHDNGIGIPEPEQARLKRFDFASRRGTNGEKGTGLGLILCREFAQLNGGNFWFRSEPGQGSTFGFSLPLA